jgi:hypothetical protein
MWSTKIDTDCRCNGTELFGKVKIVEHSPDLNAQVVESFADLKVAWVTVTARLVDMPGSVRGCLAPYLPPSGAEPQQRNT